MGKEEWPCWDGTNQYDPREIRHVKLIAHFKDGSTKNVPKLLDYEDLKTSGRVKKSYEVEVVA